MPRKSILRVLVATGALTLGVGAGVATSTYITDAAHASTNEPAAAVGHSIEEFAITDTGRLPSTGLPDEMLTSDLPETINLKTARLLHQEDKTSIYAAISKKGEMCLITFIGGEQWVVSTACTSLDQFAKTGLGLRTDGVAGASESYLLPDAMASRISRGTGSLKLGSESSNLVTIDPFAANTERVSISRSSPALTLLPEIGDE